MSKGFTVIINSCIHHIHPKRLRRKTSVSLFVIPLCTAIILPLIVQQHHALWSSSRHPSADWETALHVLFLNTANLNNNNNSNHNNQSSSTPRSKRPVFTSMALLEGTWAAHFENGTAGYVADPTRLRRDHQTFLQSYQTTANVSRDVFLTHEYYATDTNLFNYTFQARNVCDLRVSWGAERAGWPLLLYKLRLAKAPAIRKSPRLLCAIYTYNGRRDQARTAALTWGHQCDGFLAFSTETIPSLGMVNFTHPGEESYMTMWQKVRSIWGYLQKHYLEQYDFFHLGGDDMYVLVGNLRLFLCRVEEQLQKQGKRPEDQPIMLGALAKSWKQITGGPGYTLSRAALKKFGPQCYGMVRTPAEDVMMSRCMQDKSVPIWDSRDQLTGEQQYHHLDPDRLFRIGGPNSQAPAYAIELHEYWATLPHPQHPNQTTGPKIGLDAAAPYSVSFHYLKPSSAMLRIHVILHRSCPPDSKLAKTIREKLRLRFDRKHAN